MFFLVRSRSLDVVFFIVLSDVFLRFFINFLIWIFMFVILVFIFVGGVDMIIGVGLVGLMRILRLYFLFIIFVRDVGFFCVVFFGLVVVGFLVILFKLLFLVVAEFCKNWLVLVD